LSGPPTQIPGYAYVQCMLQLPLSGRNTNKLRLAQLAVLLSVPVTCTHLSSDEEVTGHFRRTTFWTQVQSVRDTSDSGQNCHSQNISDPRPKRLGTLWTHTLKESANDVWYEIVSIRRYVKGVDITIHSCITSALVALFSCNIYFIANATQHTAAVLKSSLK